MKITSVRDRLQSFEFGKLFIEELGWSNPRARGESRFTANDRTFTFRQIAQLADVPVFEVTTDDGLIPVAADRMALHRETQKLHLEHLLIFLDNARSRSLWSVVKKEGGRTIPREHSYIKGQPGDLFIGKLSGIVFEAGDFDARGTIDVAKVAGKLKQALDIERVTKKFFAEFQTQHLKFVDLIVGIDDDRDRHWYASVLLNRLMFIWFLQGKGFLDNGRYDYLRARLAESTSKGKDLFFTGFLHLLFFEGFAKPEKERDPEITKRLGAIRYLNGGLFLKHGLELKHDAIDVPDVAFANLFDLFEKYSWNLNDTPGGNDNEINPDVLGYIFEKYINQKQFGAYYTRPEITDYLCERTIHQLILDQINTPGIDGVLSPRNFTSIENLLFTLDEKLCRELLDEVLPSLTLLDPACGSGAFLVAAMKTLVNIYSAVIGRIAFVGDRKLKEWKTKIEGDHPSISHYIKKRIITDNLYGVDIMEEATEIAKLRLFLALVASVHGVDELEPLPNIDFNILPGNSLIGLMRVDETAYNRLHAGDMFTKSYHELVAEKNRLVKLYRDGEKMFGERLLTMREAIRASRDEAIATLNEMLASEFKDRKIMIETQTWDAKKGKPGKPTKRGVMVPDVEALHPFHWGYEFDEIINTRGGFDAVITNPPWEIFKPNAKEFFAEHSALVTRNTMTIKEFEKERAKLLKNPAIREAWLAYQGRFPHVSAYYRSAPQFVNQISIVNGKKAGTDINLYKLFTEQCFNLLRDGGRCGIVIPSGIYTDLGAKRLRELLFERTQVTGLFGFENRRSIFEGVDSRFKFVVLTFERGGNTTSFPAEFMRHHVEDLQRFPDADSMRIAVELIRRLSPDSLSVMEFKNEMDVQIAEKMLRFPMLGEKLEGVWNLALATEFHMTNDSHLFKTEPGKGRLPLYEGKMIHQFDASFAPPRYWIEEKEGRKALLGREVDRRQTLDYQAYRLAFRDIAASTNERTMIATMMPSNAFVGNTAVVSQSPLEPKAKALIIALLNSLVVDWMTRRKVTSHCNMFYIYQLPLPRLTASDAMFGPIVERGAKLICAIPEFDALAAEVGLGSHENGATDPVERARLRAELDGMIAHLYGLTREEFAHVLATFPIVPQEVKEAAMDEYVKMEEGRKKKEKDDDAVVALIRAGESASVEFKETLEADSATGEKHQGVLVSALKTIAAFLNTPQGGTLLIGVADDGRVAGLAPDLNLVRKKSADGLELKLRSLLKDRFHPHPIGLVAIDFPSVDGQMICRVVVERSREIIHFDDDVYARDGNQTLKLTGAKLTGWVKGRG